MATNKDKVYRWGIIGCGRISNDFCNALTGYNRAKIVACAARKLESARKFAKKYDIDRAYSSYDEIVKDGNIDIMYIGTIHPSHYNNVISCLENGIHVLCEKPMGINYFETKQMIDCALRNKRFLLEGIWTRYFPAVKQVKKWIDDGVIGTPRHLQCDFGLSRSGPKQSPTSWMNELNGGAFMGLGCYVIDPVQRTFGNGRYPPKISAIGKIDDKYGVDTIVAVNILYPDTQQFAQINCTGIVKTQEELIINGTKGKIKINSPMHCPTSIELYESVGREQKLVETKEYPLDNVAKFKYPKGFIFPNSEAFIYEIKHVTEECLDNDLLESPLYKWDETLLNIKISDEIRRQIGLKFNQDKLQSKL